MQDGDNDQDLSSKLDAFCDGRIEQLKEGNIRRLTFIILKARSFPK